MYIYKMQQATIMRETLDILDIARQIPSRYFGKTVVFMEQEYNAVEQCLGSCEFQEQLTQSYS